MNAELLQFIAERVDVAKYSSREQLDILELMFSQTLSLAVGKSNSNMGMASIPQAISEMQGQFENFLNCAMENYSPSESFNRDGGSSFSTARLRTRNGARRGSRKQAQQRLHQAEGLLCRFPLLHVRTYGFIFETIPQSVQNVYWCIAQLVIWSLLS